MSAHPTTLHCVCAKPIPVERATRKGAARTECARSQDNGANPVVLFRQHAHLHEPVIEENNVVDRDVIDQTVIVDGD